ncbi:hypothetical protein Golob_020864, partial [Gossypium lobatum]|nr:hypothetical protein [Gossypium lobatum]
MDDIIVSLTVARETIRYMDPKLFYKNIGGILKKANVYSFGMMLMEIAGRRKILNAYTDRSSQTYFPSWTYGRFEEENVEFGDMTKNETKI